MSETPTEAIVVAPEMQPVLSKLEHLSTILNTLEVVDNDSYTKMTLAVKDGKAEIKKIGFVLDPGISSAKEHLDFLRNQKKGYVEKWQTPIDTGDTKARDWLNKKDREATQRAADETAAKVAEQRRVADEERKTRETAADEAREKRVGEIRELLRTKSIGKREAAQLLKAAGAEEEAAKALAAADAEDLKSKPVAPAEAKVERSTVAGVPRTKHYYAALEPDGAEVLMKAFRAAKSDAERLFLARFVKIDEMAISKHARETQDSAKVMAEIPGVKAWDSY